MLKGSVCIFSFKNAINITVVAKMTFTLFFVFSDFFEILSFIPSHMYCMIKLSSCKVCTELLF